MKDLCKLTDEQLEHLNNQSIEDKILERMEEGLHWCWMGFVLGDRGYILECNLAFDEGWDRKKSMSGKIIFKFDNLPVTRENISEDVRGLMKKSDEYFKQAQELLKKS